MPTAMSLPPPGLDVSNEFLRRLPHAHLLKAVNMRLRFAMRPEKNPMRIFGETKTIFVRVPKNASSSLSAMLYPGPEADSLPHFSAAFYRQVFPSQYADWLVFAPLRNPMDRFASAFTYYREKTTVPEERRLMDEELPFLKTFDDFVHWLNDQPSLSTPRILKWHHFRKQVDFVCDRRGIIITDLMFPVEDMSIGLERLKAHVGQREAVQRLNTTRPLDLSHLPLERLQKYYADDIMLWQDCMTNKVIEST